MTQYYVKNSIKVEIKFFEVQKKINTKLYLLAPTIDSRKISMIMKLELQSDVQNEISPNWNDK